MIATGRARIVRVLAAVAALALLIGAGALVVGHHRHDARTTGADEALDLAQQRVVRLLSYDYRTIDHQVADTESWLTGSFAATYSKLVDDTVGPAAKKGRVVARAKVVASGIEKAAADKVSMIIFIDVAAARDTGGKTSTPPQVLGSRLRVTETKVGSQWLISAIDPI